MKMEKPGIIEVLNYDQIRYTRYTDRSPEHERGTVIIHGKDNDRMIKDYPHILRVYMLEKGIKRFFGEDYFYAEEKIDGYNVRIIKHGGDILALTRGGFICPFSTEWVKYWQKDFRLNDFFSLYPHMIICAEFAGDNPYNSKRDPGLPQGLSFFCFDIMHNDGTLLPVEEKYKIFKGLDLPCVKSFGKFRYKNIKALKDIVLELNSRSREGVVLKGVHGGRAIKFVTAGSDLNDIEKALAYFYDIESGFYSNRLMRISLFVQEFKLDEPEYIKRVGEAVLRGYSFLKNFEKSIEMFTIYMHSLDNWMELEKLIIQHKDIVQEASEISEINGVKLYKIVFGRKHRKSTERFHQILSGHEE